MSTSWAEPFNQTGENNATQQTQVSTPAAFNPYPNREHQQAIATEYPYARFMYGHNQTSFQTEPFTTNGIPINSENATPQPTLTPTHRESGIPNACCTACNKAKVRKGGCVKLPGGGCERCERKGIQCIPKYRSYPTNRAKVNTSAKAQRKKLERPSS